MDVIASTAFGIDIDTQSSTDHPFVTNARPFFGVSRKRSKRKQLFIVICLCKLASESAIHVVRSGGLGLLFL